MSREGYWGRITASRLSRRRLLISGAALSVGTTALALIGCNDDDDRSDQDSSISKTSDKPKPGGNYATYMSSINNYNVVSNTQDATNNSGITAYDRPITARLDKRGFVLEAMEKIELPEPTKVVMTLKPGMVYQNKAPVNGRKVLGSDIEATQAYVKTLSTAQNSQFQRTFLDRVEVPNDTTVIYHLKTPSAYLFSTTYLANPGSQSIIPKEILDALDSTPALGSGPFELTDHVYAQKYNYKKFENFREAKHGMPYFTTRQVLLINDAVAQEAAFRSGQIHEWQAPGAAVERLKSELDKTKFTQEDYLATTQSGFNTMNNAADGGPRPWHDIRVREAIYRLTDKQQYADLAFAGQAVVNRGPLTEGLVAWHLEPKEVEKYYKRDLTAAKQLLSAANYDSSKEWEIICSNTTTINATMAEVFQQQMAPVGFKVRIASMPSAEYRKLMVASKFDIWFGNQPGDDTPARALRNNHSNTNDQFSNVGLYNKEIDALIEKSEITVDRNENIKQVKEILKRCLDLYTTAFNVVTEQRYLFYDARLQNYLIDPFLGHDYQYDAWFA